MRKIVEALNIGRAYGVKLGMEDHPGFSLIEAALTEARAAQSGEWVTVPREWRVSFCTSSCARPGDRWEVYDPNGSGGVITESDIPNPQIRGLLDALAASPPAPAAEPVALVYGTRIQWTDHGRNIRLPAGSPVYAAPPPVAKTIDGHCQNGRGDVCLAGSRDGICCPPDSCDIDDGIRPAAPPPVEASQQQATELSRLTAERDALLTVRETLKRECEALKAEAEALRKDAERLEFVLYAGAFLVFKDADSGAKMCQLWVQDEDENHHAISGRRWFACPRAAIDAAIAAHQGEKE